MSVKKLKKYAVHPNIADDLDEQLLLDIGQQVLEGFKHDESSNSEWLADIKRIVELAGLKANKKSTPLPNSANVKLPLISKACYEFSSRLHPEIVKDDRVVKPKILGKEKDEFKQKQSERVCDFMNYQLLLKDGEWQQQLVMLLFRLALIGFIVKKTYYDPIRRKVKHILCKPDELIIHAESESLESAPRVSHVMHWRLNDIVEYKNKVENDVRLFLEDPVEDLCKQHGKDTKNPCIDLIEQCTYLDLDEDGYLEPYIVTVTKDSGKVLRIVAQYEKEDIFKGKDDEVCYINKTEYYEDFHFLPNPNGCFQSVGFGILLLNINESANSALNQLLDAAQLANMKGGYMDARLKQIPSGNSMHDPGEFKLLKINAGGSLKDGILPIQFGEPSSVMYQLLGLLIDVSRDLTSSAQINNGTQSSENAKTGATLALQQEGKKIFTSIGKSIYNSLSKEFKHIFKLNGLNISQEEYMNVLDNEMANVKKDFDPKTVDVMPIADPNLASDQQRLLEATTIQQLMALPGVDPVKATQLILDRIAIPGIKDIMVDVNAPQPPNVEMLKFQAETENNAQKLNIAGAELDIQEKQLIIQAHLAEANIAKMQADSMLALAKAESEDVKMSLADYQLQLQAISKQIDATMNMAQFDQKNAAPGGQAPQGAPQLEAPPQEVAPNDPTQGLAGMAGVPGNPGDVGPGPGA